MSSIMVGALSFLLTGLTRIEEITWTATKELLDTILRHNGRPINLEEEMFKCISDIIAILLIG